MGESRIEALSVNMNTHTGLLVVLLSLEISAQRRGGLGSRFRQGRDGSAAGDYSSPAEYGGGVADAAVASYQASDAGADPLSALASSIPGVPGEDYPIYSEVPESGFSCDGQVDGGYYADPEAECQAFHICTADGAGGLAKYSFLCPNGTIFNQNYFICDWWFNFDCAQAEELYSLNDDIAAERAEIDAAASDAEASYAAPSDAPAEYGAAPEARSARQRSSSGRNGRRQG